MIVHSRRWPVLLLCSAWSWVALAQPAAVVRYVQPEPATQAAPLRLSASVNSPLQSTLSVDVAGRVAEVLVDAGSRVQAGTVLLRLDAELAALAVRQAEAALHEAQVALDDARRLREEGQRLTAQGSLPASEQSSREARARAAQATLQRLQVERDQARALNDRHQVRAPYAGVISRRSVAPGTWVTPGTAVLELTALDPLRLDLQLPQHSWAQLAPDPRIQIRLDAFPGESWPGQLLERVPVIDPQSRSALVRVRLQTPDPRVLPGMSGTVSLQLDNAEAALSVPRDALLRFPDGSRVVWVIDGEGEDTRVRRQPVDVTAERGEQVLVRNGLTLRDRIVVRGNETLREGQRVRAQAQEPEA